MDLARLLVDELAAHPVPGGQAADRLRTGQCLDGQVHAVALGQQPGRRADTSAHTRTIDENPEVPSPIPAAPTRPHVWPGFEPRPPEWPNLLEFSTCAA